MKREKIQMPKFVDYKDTALLKKFLNPHARIIGKKKSGLAAETQRSLAMAVKRARYMALLPFVSR